MLQNLLFPKAIDCCR